MLRASTLAPGSAELLCLVWVFQQRKCPASEARALAKRHEKAGFAGNDQLARATGIGGNHGQAGGHCFENGARLPVVRGGPPKHIALLENARDIGARAQKVNAMLD